MSQPAGATEYSGATTKVPTRDRILSAMRRILARSGASAVTLDSVAAEAGVSKGGLLYHFRSKEALYAGLLEAAEQEVAAGVAAKLAEYRPVRAYLEYALPASEEEAAYTTALIAAVRADDSAGPDAAARLAGVFALWDQPLLDTVNDPALAQIVRSVGHGLYLGAAAGMPTPPPEIRAAMIARLVELCGEEPAP